MVTTASVPQAAPLQPTPESVHVSWVAGFEPATGVSVAAITPEPPDATLGGAESWSEKLLVIVTAAEACFAGSATLCAVIVAFAAAGKICGAV